jgi:hypothetical protein
MSFTVILSIGFTFIICLSASASASFVLFAIVRSPPLNVFFSLLQHSTNLTAWQKFFTFLSICPDSRKTGSNLQSGAPTEVSDVRAK